MKKTLLVVLTLIFLPSTCQAQEDAADKKEVKPGVITAHFNGLHGYIGFDASRPSDRMHYSAGMGFYSAVWPLIAEPIADFQIGLPSA
jgi:hypothetical protein